MNSKECEEQLMRLIYDWETEGLLTKINATDIEAIKHLMLENQMQQDTIKTQKLVINNLSERITKAIEYIKIYRSYQKIDNKDYLKGKDEIGCLDIYQVDELLDILKEV